MESQQKRNLREMRSDEKHNRRRKECTKVMFQRTLPLTLNEDKTKFLTTDGLCSSAKTQRTPVLLRKKSRTSSGVAMGILESRPDRLHSPAGVVGRSGKLNQANRQGKGSDGDICLPANKDMQSE